MVAALGCASPLLAGCREVAVPIEYAVAVEVQFDAAVPQRQPSAVHTYGLEIIVSREAIDTIADEQLYTFVHVTRCSGGEIIAIAETKLDNLDLIDFDGLRRKLDKDPAGRFRLSAKFSSPTIIRSGEACLAFDGGSYAAGQASSRPIPITVKKRENP
jgi:hypothetical protein